MKADVTAENKPAYFPPEKEHWHRDRIGHKGERKTHKDQGGVQVSATFLHEVTVVFVGCTLEVVVEITAGAVGRSRVARKDSFHRLEHGIFQAGNEKHG